MSSLASAQTLIGSRPQLFPSIASIRGSRKRELSQLGSSRPSSRTIYVNNFKINYQFQKFMTRFDSTVNMPITDNFRNYFLCVTPIDIVISDTIQKIEVDCQKRWPQLMVAREYTMEDLKQMQLMKAFIKAKLDVHERYQILMYLFEKAQFYPYTRSSVRDFAWVEVLDVDCKLWNDRPHLELSCAVYFDTEQYFLQILKDNFVRFRYYQKFQFGIMEIQFLKPFPQLVYYLNKPMFNKMMLDYFDFAMNKFNSPYLKKMAPFMREVHETIYRLPKTVEVTDRNVLVTFDKVKRLVGSKIDSLNKLERSPLPSRITAKSIAGLKNNKATRKYH